MLKKSLILLSGTMLIASVGFAAPLTDYSSGKFAIDLTVSPSLEQVATNMDKGYEFVTDGVPISKSSVTYGLTAGLGNNWAVQYRSHRVNSETGGNFSIGTKLSGYEANILYKVDKNFFAFAGYTNFKLDLYENLDGKYTGKSTSGAQIRAVVVVPVSDKVSTYGIVSTGSKVDNFEVGLSYKINKNVDFNMGYADRKYKGLTTEHFSNNDGPMSTVYKAGLHTQGVNWGVTIKL